jgi:hypothetical protein
MANESFKSSIAKTGIKKIASAFVVAIFLAGCQPELLVNRNDTASAGGSIDDTDGSNNSTSGPGDGSGAGSRTAPGPNPLVNPGVPAPLPITGPDIGTAIVHNPYDDARSAQAVVAVPFPRGHVTEAQMLTRSYGAEGSLGHMMPARFYYNPDGTKHSVKIGHLRWHTQFAQGQTKKEVQIIENIPIPPPAGHNTEFQMHPLLNQFGLAGLRDSFSLTATINGVAHTARFDLPPIDRIRKGGILGRVFQARFKNSSGVPAPGVGAIGWIQYAPNQEFFTMTFGVHNSYLMEPIAGSGVSIQNLRVNVADPMYFRFLNPQAQGSLPVSPNPVSGVQTWNLLTAYNLVDGAYILYQGVGAVLPLGTNDPSFQSFIAESESPLIGLMKINHWRDRRVSPGATSYIPNKPSGFTEDQMMTQLQTVCNIPAGSVDNATPLGGPYPSPINRNPAGTGDQPDFAAGTHDLLVAAIHSGSVCPLVANLTVLPRDGQRAQSIYIENRNGVLDFLNVQNYPELFTYSSRIFGVAQRYNGEPEIFRTRASTPFNSPPVFTVNDSQHMTVESLVQTYFLTGSFFLFDWTRQYVALNYWNGLTRQAGLGMPSAPHGINLINSERETRAFKALILALEVDNQNAAENLIRTRIKERLVETWLPALNRMRNMSLGAAPPSGGRPATCLFSPGTPGCLEGWNISRSPMAGIDYFMNDNRVDISILFPNEPIQISWQTGFTMEMMAAFLRVGIENPQLKTMLDAYFEGLKGIIQPMANGEPWIAEYLVLRDPIRASQNPASPGVVWFSDTITPAWRAGYLVAADEYQSFYNQPAPQQATLNLLTTFVGCEISTRPTYFGGTVRGYNRWSASWRLETPQTCN